ncbi:heavy metal translocating P-type ATPase [Mycobacterium sp. SMC-4]|uniref:heavy metal translocating P-type ATPase n=1 Tax=Mycobacterium sp. SMC-4 TaxID=2857059 RepID=UPI0021B30973|nr:heavy metal translocating P-type ATPase [Mycobacterium sp. SMC-4]UXA18445.1 heavy metal translocating P-type ATPase [Mycobacterium sp. SMC-4]
MTTSPAALRPPGTVTRAPRRGTDLWAVGEVRWAALALLFFVLGLITQLADGAGWLQWGFYLACYLSGGWEPARSGLVALGQRRLDVDLLMVAAAAGAAAIGQVFDGALLIVIFATSGALEAWATKRTEDSVRGLLDLAPETATRLTESGEEVIDAGDLVVGDILIIRPGERIGGDGVVTDGASDVDQATITGEPLPVDKRPGDQVFAGTVNGTGTLTVRVEMPAAETVIARIVAMVEEASASKAKLQLFIEKVEQRYSVGMVGATVALFSVPLMLGADVQSALLRAMTFMIVASPCALVLSTMPPLLASIANASRHGVLVKSAVALEKLGTVTHVAVDKTGTLTQGQPRVTQVRVAASPWTPSQVLALAAAVETPSEHPLAAAVVAAARADGLPIPRVTAFASVPGRGVRGQVGDHRVEVGVPRTVGDEALGDPGASARTLVDEVIRAGDTTAVVRVDDQVVGVLGLSDRVRDESADAVSRLAALTGRTPLLLTGDNAASARQLADAVGIEQVKAGLLPQDKVAAVRELQSGGAKVMVVGDGVNDAPAMAAAHVAVAMGRTGSDLTLDTADAVIIRDDLSTLPAAVALAQRARRLVMANLVIAASFIVVLVTWDLVGHLPLPLGVAGHEGSTILVALNGLRLLRNAAWPGPSR